MSLDKSDFDKFKKLIQTEINNAVSQRWDWDTFKKLIRLEMDEALEQKLDQKLGRYPNKEEFYVSMDKLMKELENIRDEVDLTPSHTEFEKLKQKVDLLEKNFASI